MQTNLGSYGHEGIRVIVNHEGGRVRVKRWKGWEVVARMGQFYRQKKQNVIKL